MRRGRPKNADKYLKFWQDLLGLSQWTIGIYRDKTMVEKKGFLGEAVWTAEDETATISLATDKQIRDAGDPFLSLESLILHELLHIRHHGHLTMEDWSKVIMKTDLHAAALERALNAETRAFMKLKGQNETRVS